MLGWELPPHNTGGLGAACYYLSRALSRQGVDIEFVLPYTADHSSIDFMKITAAHPQDVVSVISSGIAYDSYKYVYSSGDIKSVDIFGQSLIYEQAISRIVELADFDIIHAHDWLTCRAAIKAKMITGKPLFVHFHSIEADRSGKVMGGNPLVRDIEYLAAHIADQVIAVSQNTKDGLIREYGVPADKIEVLHNSIDESVLEPYSGDNAYTYLDRMKSNGYHVLASVGRLTIQKGLPNMLRSFAKVLDSVPKTILLITGSGEQYYELIGLAADLGILHNVMFSGFQRGKAYRDAFSLADLFIMPSVSEPFGITALESIGYGTPVLISKQSGVGEVIKNCLRVDSWDVDEMANKIVGVLQNPGIRNELHRNSYDEWKRLSWDQPAAKLRNIYSSQLAGVCV